MLKKLGDSLLAFLRAFFYIIALVFGRLEHEVKESYV